MGVGQSREPVRCGQVTPSRLVPVPGASAQAARASLRLVDGKGAKLLPQAEQAAFVMLISPGRAHRGKLQVGAHFVKLVAIGGALTATLYSQQRAPQIACPGVLDRGSCDTRSLHCDAPWSVPQSRVGSFQSSSFAHFPCWGSESKQNELAPACLRISSFPFFGECRSDSCDTDLSAYRNGDRLASTQSVGRLFSPGRAADDLGGKSQGCQPVRKSTQSSAGQDSGKHIFWLVPAFHVSYLKQFRPLTPREKFDEWLQGTYDSRGLSLYALESATLERSSRDGFCGYGRGWGNYGKCFGSMELDANISSFFGDFLFPVILHQDPRYFRLGEGPLGRRAWYAVSRVFVTHADSGRTVFFTSALSGSVLAAAASNLYYPPQDRGFHNSINRMGIDLFDTALYNVAAEFWPDIKHKLGRTF